MAQARNRKGKTGDQGSDMSEERRSTPAMDEGSQHQNSGQGGQADQAAHSGRYQGSSGRSREDEDLATLSSQADHSEKDLSALQEEEISGSDDNDLRSVNYSDTDVDENEGLGDGKLGRTVRDEVDE